VTGQPEGQMDIFDVLPDELAGEPSPARAIKILDQAKELGWTLNPFASLVIRLTRDDALPFFAKWDLSVSESGKKSWRFTGARAANGQPLAYGDIKAYLEDPRVIYPEPPDELCEAAEHENPDRTMEGAVKALAPLTGQSSSFNEWGEFFQ